MLKAGKFSMEVDVMVGLVGNEVLATLKLYCIIPKKELTNPNTK